MSLRFLVLNLGLLICCASFAQIDIVGLIEAHGEGKVSLKKKIKVSFKFDEDSQTFQAKVKHFHEDLYIGNKESEGGYVQLPFNTFQDIKLEKARYFSVDTLGERLLLENVKVRYAESKDYYIENIFYNDLKVKQFRCEVDLTENYIIQYSYTETYKDLKFLNSIYLQSREEAVEDVELSFQDHPAVDLNLFEFNMGNEFKKETTGTGIKYSAQGLARFKKNGPSVASSYYLPHVVVCIKSVGEGSSKENILSTTDDLYAWYASLIEELNPDENYIRGLASDLVKGAVSDEEKVAAIFDWVKKHVQYVAFEDGIAGFRPAEAQEVAKSKFGDCKGMANLLVELLRAEGFDAQHAWIGTRNRDYGYSMPSLVVDNHMICALNMSGSTFFLDGTDSEASWATPPAHLMDKEVLVSTAEGYEIQKIPRTLPEESRMVINGHIDMSKHMPVAVLDVELSGFFEKDYRSYSSEFPVQYQKYAISYLLKDFFGSERILGIKEPQHSKGSVKCKVQMSFSEFAKGPEGTLIFPFFDLLSFSPSMKDEAPIYIDFPYTVDLELNIQGVSGRAQIPSESDLQELGVSQDFNASFAVKGSTGGLTVNQKLVMNVLHSPKEKREDWNRFVESLEERSQTAVKFN